MPLSEAQVAELTGGADTPLHSHAFDRAMTHASLDELQALKKFTKVAANYTASYKDDFLLVDSTAGAIAIAVPFSKGQKEMTVVRVSGAGNVTLNAAASDTINGAATLVIATSYTPARLKSFKGFGWVSI